VCYFGGAGGADVWVVSVRRTVDEPSCCSVVVSLVSEVLLLPESVLMVDCVRVVVVDFGGGILLAQAAMPRVDAINNAVVVNERHWLVMLFIHARRGPKVVAASQRAWLEANKHLDEQHASTVQPVAETCEPSRHRLDCDGRIRPRVPLDRAIWTQVCEPSAW
jgi:hypothetical protein